MTEEEDKLLCQKYPKIFKDRHSSITETCMAWGFECGSGWFNIIDTLCNQIQQHVDWKSKNLSAEDIESLQVIALQVKEKFGTLRFYYSGGDEMIEGMIRMAEAMTHKICEDCGAPGHRYTKGWHRTLCNSCEISHVAARSMT